MVLLHDIYCHLGAIIVHKIKFCFNHVIQFFKGGKVSYLFLKKKKKKKFKNKKKKKKEKRRSRKTGFMSTTVRENSSEFGRIWSKFDLVRSSHDHIFFSSLLSPWYLSAGSISTERKQEEEKKTNQCLYSYLETTTSLSPCRRNYCCIENRVKLFAKSPNLQYISKCML